ncbi:hypothetical protein Tco_0393013 [Tanacetum coccineum]
MKHLKTGFFFIDRRAIPDAIGCRWKCYGLPFYCTPYVVAEAVIPDPTPKDLAVGTPSFKIVCLGLIIRYTRPGLFVGDDDESKDDDDACVEIPLVIPLCSAAGLVRKFLASDEFSRVQGELLSLAASVGFERGFCMHRTKDEFAMVLKKKVNFMPGAQDRLAKASPLLLKLTMPFLTRFLSMQLNLYQLSFSLSLRNWFILPTSPFQGVLVLLLLLQRSRL